MGDCGGESKAAPRDEISQECGLDPVGGEEQTRSCIGLDKCIGELLAAQFSARRVLESECHSPHRGTLQSSSSRLTEQTARPARPSSSMTASRPQRGVATGCVRREGEGEERGCRWGEGMMAAATMATLRDRVSSRGSIVTFALFGPVGRVQHFLLFSRRRAAIWARVSFLVGQVSMCKCRALYILIPGDDHRGVRKP